VCVVPSLVAWVRMMSQRPSLRGVSAVAGLLIAAGEGWVSWRADVLTAVQAAGLVFAECGGRVTGGRGVVARPVGDALPKAAVV